MSEFDSTRPPSATPQPEYVWAFPPERQRHPGRVWLIVVLSLVAVAIVGAVLWFTVFAAPSATPSPTPTASVSPSSSASPSPSPSASASATPSATETPSPSTSPAPTPQETVSEPPAPVDPEIPAFRDQVQPRLGEANTGLDFLSTTSGPDASMLVSDLRADALRLVESPAPSSISSAWQGSVDGYLGALDALDAAIAAGSDLSAAIDNARGEIAILNDLLT